MTITSTDLQAIIAAHGKWLRGEGGGSRANFSDADLPGANFSDAHLSGANFSGAHLPAFSICPEVGAFVAFKKLHDGFVAQITVPAEAARTSSLVGRKCRAEFVMVDSITNRDGKTIKTGTSWRSKEFIYRVGEIARPDSYDPNPNIECAHGIHFFITRREAEQY